MEGGFRTHAQLNKIKCRFVELKSGRVAESQQGRGQKSAPLLCFVPLPSSPPVAGAGDVKRPHAPAPPPPDGGGREGKVKKAPALHLGLAGNRKETGYRWRAGRPCSSIVAQVFKLVKPPLGAYPPSAAGRAEGQGRPKAARPDPCPEAPGCGTPEPGGAGRKNGPAGREERAAPPKGARGQGEPARHGRGHRGARSAAEGDQTGSPAQAKGDPKTRRDGDRARAEASPAQAGPGHAAARPAGGGRGGERRAQAARQRPSDPERPKGSGGARARASAAQRAAGALAGSAARARHWPPGNARSGQSRARGAKAEHSADAPEPSGDGARHGRRAPFGAHERPQGGPSPQAQPRRALPPMRTRFPYLIQGQYSVICQTHG